MKSDLTQLRFDSIEVSVKTGALIHYLGERYEISREQLIRAITAATTKRGTTPAKGIFDALARDGNHCLVGRSLVVERLYEWAIERAMFEERIRSAERHLSA